MSIYKVVILKAFFSSKCNFLLLHNAAAFHKNVLFQEPETDKTRAAIADLQD